MVFPRGVLEGSITLRILDEIHSFLCCCITYDEIDEFGKREWKSIENWQQTILRSDVLCFSEVCVGSIDICILGIEENEVDSCNTQHDTTLPYDYRSTGIIVKRYNCMYNLLLLFKIVL